MSFSPAPMEVSVPWVAEETFGQQLGARIAGGSPGPADLVHLTRASAHGDGGWYHHVNGLDYSAGACAVQSYALGAAGVEQDSSGYYTGEKFGQVVGGRLSDFVVVTVCSYNALARAELRARFEISASDTAGRSARKRRVTVRAQYTVTTYPRLAPSSQKTKTGQQGRHGRSTAPPRTVTCTGDQVEPTMWNELATCTLVRSFAAADEPIRPGPVNLPLQTRTSAALIAAIRRAVCHLPRGHALGARACYGTVSDCDRDATPTTRYRNRLVDTLVRLVRMEPLGSAAEIAADMVHEQYGPTFAVVEARLLGAQYSSPNERRFIALAHEFVATNPWLTQTALILIEQVRFLVSRGAFVPAERLALRAVRMLPLDFDCWWHLALCHTSLGDTEAAIATLNSIPVNFNCNATYPPSPAFAPPRCVPLVGPPPANDKEERSGPSGEYDSVWRTRPPAVSPVASASPLELSVLDPVVARVSVATAPRPILSMSSGAPCALDFDRASTWGRAYDLLTLMAAVLGWDRLVHAKARVLKRRGEDPNPQDKAQGNFLVSSTDLGRGCAERARPQCAPWIDQLFLVVYDDLSALMTAARTEADRSALSWLMIGMLGWNCKQSWLDSISALMTSASAVAADGGFDYYSSLKLLEIYSELILSSVDASTVDTLGCLYDRHFYSTKFLLLRAPDTYTRDVSHLELGLFSLEQILLLVIKCVSCSLRWYNYVPPFVAIEILIKLCYKHDPVYIRTMIRVVYESERIPAPKKLLRLQRMFLALNSTSAQSPFTLNDSLAEYMYALVDWIERLRPE